MPSDATTEALSPAAVAPPAAAPPRPPEPMVAMPLGMMLLLGNQAFDGGRMKEAEAIASNLLRAAPDEPRVLQLGAIVAFRLERRPLAIQLLEKAIRLEPRTSLYYRNISEMYRQVGRLDDALAAAAQAVSLLPGDPIALHNLAIIHHGRGELDQSLVCSRRAVALKPDMAGAHFAIGETLLLRGEMTEGWEEYEWRFRIPGVQPLMPPAVREAQPQWGGGRLGAGRRLMLVGDQGFGDVIQFSRYIPWVRSQTEEVFLATSREMAPLLRRLFPDLELQTRWADCRQFAAYSALSGLPRLHGTRLETIPPPIPILPDPERVAVWTQRLAEALPEGVRRIGIVWAGRPTHKNDRNRSIAFAQLAATLGGLPGVALVSLQKGDREADLKAYEGTAPLFDAAPHLADYEDTAAAIAALDLVVTVDTSVAHLSGAMGRPTWVLLPFMPDWRWLQGRPDSPWYPSVRLFRQHAPGAWEAPLAAVAAEL